MANYFLLGASSAIAFDFMRRCTAEDTIFAATRNPEMIDVAELSCTVNKFTVDAQNLEEVAVAVQQAHAESPLDGVVNFCGSILLKPFHLLSASDWHETMRINLDTAFNLAHAVTATVKKNCHLVFFSTAAAHLGLPNHEAIAAAKSAVEGLARSLAASYAKANLRCNVIAPGLIDTPLSQMIFKSERAKQVSQSMHGLPRLGKPGDVASLLVWLLTPENHWITGEVIRVDGGLSTVKLAG